MRAARATLVLFASAALAASCSIIVDVPGLVDHVDMDVDVDVDVDVDAAVDADADAGDDTRDDTEAGDRGEEVDREDADDDHDYDYDHAEGDADVGPDCGNGRLDSGEECDDGNDVSGDGCEATCRYSCHAASDCDEPDACTTDSCDAGGTGRICSHEAIDCADTNDCTADSCHPADGCVHTPIPGCCRNDGDCDDSEACTTDDCNEATGNCTNDPVAAGTACPDEGSSCTDDACSAAGRCVHTPAPGRACDDGAWCTPTDLCDGAGRCVGTGTRCADELACTTDSCDEATDACSHPVASGWCLIADACWAEGALNPANSCQACVTSRSRSAWTNREGGPSCDDGAFCNGTDTCNTAGACVHSGDPCATGGCFSCNEVGDTCEPATGCYIDDACWAEEAVNPANSCQWCEPVISATGWSVRPDFSPCVLVTSPDRSYDICAGGTCVSPGCGDPTCNAPGPNWTPPDTGHRSCYDSAGTIACPGTAGGPACGATSWCGQDAQYGWDVAHAASERFTRTEPVTDQPIVLDNVTGLIWQGCTVGRSAANCRSGGEYDMRWTDGLDRCETLSWAGQTDWRLPDRWELQSIVDYGQAAGPFIDPTAFPMTPVDRFWSSSAKSSGTTWSVSFASGNVVGITRDNDGYVRCVRGGPGPDTSSPRFVRTEPVPGQPVVADAVTGLIWQGCAVGTTGTACTGTHSTHDWRQALAECQNLSWGGFGDWYLPNAKELHGLINDRRTRPMIDTTAFPGTPDAWFWTSSSYVPMLGYGWLGDFANGDIGVGSLSGDAAVRCVRQGP